MGKGRVLANREVETVTREWEEYEGKKGKQGAASKRSRTLPSLVQEGI